MKTWKSNRLLALALSLCMTPAMLLLSGTAFAAEPRCGHVHNMAECAYVEAVEGQPCAEAAAHVHDTAVCGYVEAVTGAPCNHIHDDICGGLAQDGLSNSDLPALPQNRAGTIPEMTPEAVGFAGEEWWVIGKDGVGISSANGTITLLSKKKLFSVMFHESSSEYSGSTLHGEMKKYYEGLSADEKALILPRALDGVRVGTIRDTTLSGDHFVWPLSKAEAESLPQATIRANGTGWWNRSASLPPNGENSACVVSGQGTLTHSTVSNAWGVRPALTINLNAAIVASVSAGEGGSIAPCGNNMVLPKNQTFTIKANDGYQVEMVLVNGTPVTLNGDSFTLTNAAANCIIVASFAEKTPIDVPGVTNGSTVYFAGNEWFVIGLNGQGVNSENRTMTLLSRKNLIAAGAFGPNNQYGASDLKNRMEAYYNGLPAAEQALILPRELDDVRVGNTSPATLTGDHYIWPLSMTEANSLTDDSIRANGYDWWLRSSAVSNGYVRVVNSAGKTNARVAPVSETLGGRPALTIDLDAAVFASVTAGKGGSITPSGNVALPKGGSQKFTLKTNRGYKLDQLLVNGQPVALSGDSYTLTGANANCTIEARFVLEFEPVTLPGIALYGRVGYAGNEWYVIGLNEENGSVNPNIGAMTLLARDNLIAQGAFGSDNQYGTSTLRVRMEAYYNGDTLLVQEKGLILPRTLDSVRIDRDVNATLDGDHYVWPLSLAEAESLPRESICANDSTWWLRSPLPVSDYAADTVGSIGYVSSSAVGMDFVGARPALTLNLDSVLFTFAATGGKPVAGSGLIAYAAPTGTVKLTVRDDACLSLDVTTIAPITARVGETASFAYTGAKTGAGRSVSVLIQEKATGEILYYGRPVDCASGNGSGTASFTLPHELAAGEYKLLAFNEQVNGENVTDLASTPKELELTVKAQGAGFVPVTDVTMTNAASVAINTELTLEATVAPEAATNQTIVWSVKNANGTGATINGAILRATTVGKATILATVKNGLAEGSAPESDYTKEFSITVMDPATLQVTFDDNRKGGISLTDNEMKIAVDEALRLSGKKKENITTIQITGLAPEITGYNWEYLIRLYRTDSDWIKLNTLNLTGMNSLLTVGMDPTHYLAAANLVTVQLPDSLRSIGARAFDQCNNLSNINLPSGLESIGDYAFWCADSLALTSLPDGLKTVGEYAFIRCPLKLTKLPDGLKVIGAYAFSDCSGLTLTELPGELTTLGAYAFSNCAGLTSMTLPASLTSLWSGPFAFCTNITAFHVAKENPKYESQDGVVYNKGKTLLCFSPAAGLDGTFTVPDTVTDIAYYGFASCADLTSIILPEGLTRIRFRAFYDCENLTTLTFMGDQAPPNIEETDFGRLPANGTIRFPAGAEASYTEEWKNNILQLSGWTLVPAYRLTVENGTDTTGGGIYSQGQRVQIKINAAPAGHVFDKWTAPSGSFTDAASPTTTYIMPAAHVTVTAAFHAHEYGGAWQHDDTSHWQLCIAGDGEIGNKAAHIPSGWITDLPANAITEGGEYRECTICKYEMERRTNSDLIPQTGDTANPLFWALLATAALLGCGGLLVYKKRSKWI